MAFNRVWHAGFLLHEVKAHGILGWAYGVILSFLSNSWIKVVLDIKSLQQ